MAGNPQKEQEQLLLSALSHVIAVSERVIVDRIDLARFDAFATLTQRLHDALFLATGSVLILAGWLSLSTVAVLILAQHLSLPLGLAITGTCNALVGMTMVAWALRREKTKTGSTVATGTPNNGNK